MSDDPALAPTARTCVLCGTTKPRTSFAGSRPDCCSCMNKGKLPARHTPLMQALRARKQAQEKLIREFAIAEIPETTREEAHVWRKTAYTLLAGITPEKIEAAKPKELVLSAAIAFDKAQLAEEKPTQIIKHSDREELLNLARQFASEAARRQGTVIDVTPPSEELGVHEARDG